MTHLTPETYGAIGDGVTDDTAALVELFENAGDSSVYLEGFYLISSTLMLPGGLTMIGRGRTSCGFIVADSTNSHCLWIDSADSVTLKSFSINGNRAANSAGHGVRVSEATNVTIEDLYIHDSGGYGIGMQAGTLRQIKVTSCLIEDTGSDGIDIKNLDDQNRDIEISGNTIRRPGRNITLSGQTCIDVRGPCRIIGNWCDSFGDVASTDGIRARNGEASDITGIGGQDSFIAFNHVIGGSQSTCTGINVVAYRVQVISNNIKNVNIGIQVYQQECQISHNNIQSAVVGIVFQLGTPSSLPTDANRCSCVGNSVRSATAIGYRSYCDYVMFSANAAVGCATGFKAQTGADSCIFTGNIAINSTIAGYSNSGSGTIQVNNVGF